MEKVLDRLGIYDFWIIIVPGFFLMCSVAFTSDVLLGTSIMQVGITKFNDYIVFLLLVYFVGVVLQEIGSLLKKVKFLFYNERASNPIELLTDDERIILGDALRSRFPQISHTRTQYNLVNILLQEKSVASRYMKLNVLSLTSRNCSISFLIVITISIYSICCKINDKLPIDILAHLGIVVVCALLFFLFINRANRFQQMWMKQILRAFIVTSMLEDKGL